MKHFFLLPLLLLSLSPLCLLGQFTLTDGLVAYYPFSGNAKDASGNLNHGTAIGAILTEDRFGDSASAYFFDGQDDHILVDAVSPNFKAPLPISITAWVQIHDYDLNNVFQNDFTLGVYHGAWMNIYNGHPSGHFGDGGPAGPYSRQTTIGSTQLELNQWYHLAVVIGGFGDITVYVNGQDDGGTYSGTGGPMAYSAQDGMMGVGTSSNDLYYHGKIDEIRMYDRVLTQEEIQAICDFNPNYWTSQASKPLHNPFSGELTMIFDPLPNQSPVHIKVFDLQGRLMAEDLTQAARWEVNSSSWADGVYLVKVEREDGHVEWTKVVKGG